MIGGNITATLQAKDASKKNAIGERLVAWSDYMSIYGWLDYSNGDSRHTNFNAKVQESTHVFLADYVDIGNVKSEDVRMVIGGSVYEVLVIDDPMGMHRQLEFYLQYVGGASDAGDV